MDVDLINKETPAKWKIAKGFLACKPLAYGCIDLTVEPYGFMVKELEAFVWQPASYFKSFQQQNLAEMGSLQFEHLLPFPKYA